MKMAQNVLSGKQRFKRTLNATDLGLAAVTLSVTQYLQIAAYVVPAQQIIAWGNTEAVNGGAQGATALIDLVTVAPADIEGVIRLAITDATGVKKFVVLEERSEKFRASATDRMTSVLIPESVMKATQDSILLVEMRGDAASLINVATCVMVLPITVYI